MAIAFDAATDGGQDTATSLTWAHTCTGSDRILFVGGHGDLNVNADSWSGITYNGVAMTRIIGVQNLDIVRWAYLYYLIAPATGSNNVVISSASALIAAVSTSYTGAKQTGQPDASVSDLGPNAATTTKDVLLTTVADNCWITSIAYRDLITFSNTVVRVVNATSTVLFAVDGAFTAAGSQTMHFSNNAPANFSTHMASFAPAVSASVTVPASLLTLGVG